VGRVAVPQRRDWYGDPRFWEEDVNGTEDWDDEVQDIDRGCSTLPHWGAKRVGRSSALKWNDGHWQSQKDSWEKEPWSSELWQQGSWKETKHREVRAGLAISAEKLLLLTALRESLNCTWVGCKGETYELDFAGDTHWRCIRTDEQGSRRFRVSYDMDSKLVWWGDTFYFHASEMMLHPDIVAWQRTTSKPSYRFIWRRKCEHPPTNSSPHLAKDEDWFLQKLSNKGEHHVQEKVPDRAASVSTAPSEEEAAIEVAVLQLFGTPGTDTPKEEEGMPPEECARRRLLAMGFEDRDILRIFLAPETETQWLAEVALDSSGSKIQAQPQRSAPHVKSGQKERDQLFNRCQAPNTSNPGGNSTTCTSAGNSDASVLSYPTQTSMQENDAGNPRKAQHQATTTTTTTSTTTPTTTTTIETPDAIPAKESALLEESAPTSAQTDETPSVFPSERSRPPTPCATAASQLASPPSPPPSPAISVTSPPSTVPSLARSSAAVMREAPREVDREAPRKQLRETTQLVHRENMTTELITTEVASNSPAIGWTAQLLVWCLLFTWIAMETVRAVRVISSWGEVAVGVSLANTPPDFGPELGIRPL